MLRKLAIALVAVVSLAVVAIPTGAIAARAGGGGGQVGGSGGHVGGGRSFSVGPAFPGAELPAAMRL
jgi:hypothetical protein